MTQLAIAALDDSPNVIAQLTEMLVDVVAGGASVSFMHPLDRGIARTFWETAFASAKRKECLILGMWDGNTLAGTVTVNLAMPQNQQHRAEIAKLITHPNYRGRGIASNLMQVENALPSPTVARSSCSTPPKTAAHRHSTTGWALRSRGRSPTSR